MEAKVAWRRIIQVLCEDRHKYWEKTYSDPRAKAGKDWYGPWKEFEKDVAGPAFRQSDAPWLI